MFMFLSILTSCQENPIKQGEGCQKEGYSVGYLSKSFFPRFPLSSLLKCLPQQWPTELSVMTETSMAVLSRKVTTSHMWPGSS